MNKFLKKLSYFTDILFLKTMILEIIKVVEQ